MNEFFDVVVIGGGVIGNCVTYYLSKAGMKVVLVEKGELASGASGANQGGWSAQLMRGRVMNLGIEGSRTYEGLAAELRYDFEFERVGSYMLMTDDGQLSAVEEHVRQLRQDYHMDASLLSGKELRELNPDIASDIPGACFCPHAYILNPMKLVFGFAEASKRLGAHFQIFTQVETVSVENGKVRSVITNRGEIKTRQVVIAAGSWSPQIASMLKLSLPMRPRRGQLIVTEPHPLVKTRYMTEIDTSRLAKSTGQKDPRAAEVDLMTKYGVRTVLSQHRNGNWVIGSSRDFAGYDTRTEIETVALMAKRVLKFLPNLKHASIIRAFAGLRPFCEDGHPVIDIVDHLEGLVLATGHNSEGLSLAPATGRMVVELATQGRGSHYIEEFGYGRFKEHNRVIENP
jgi:glycine/D-amino acid oxidase-like deaminating enzyme